MEIFLETIKENSISIVSFIFALLATLIGIKYRHNLKKEQDISKENYPALKKTLNEIFTFIKSLDENIFEYSKYAFHHSKSDKNSSGFKLKDIENEELKRGRKFVHHLLKFNSIEKNDVNIPEEVFKETASLVSDYENLYNVTQINLHRQHEEKKNYFNKELPSLTIRKNNLQKKIKNMLGSN